jgi:predicted HicB family RNase H-like nuclease
MGDLISRIEEDYEDYVDFCKEVGEKPMKLTSGFYEHAEAIAAKHGYKKIGRNKYVKS